MNETAAQRVLLVRAIETSDRERTLLTGDDRHYAARAAAELVRWQAADRGEQASAEAFIARRAELLGGKLAERTPRAARVLRTLQGRASIGIVVPVAACVLGLASEHLADRQRVNILAFLMLGVVAWNIAVYLWLSVRAAIALVTGVRRKPGWIQRQLCGDRGGLAGRAAGPLGAALAEFVRDWAQRSAPLVLARSARILHASAAAFALGAIAGLYVRGLVFEYRAGWESTFLDASQVHGLLAVFLHPAAWLIGTPVPGLADIAAMRFRDGAPGENAARWIHLHAATVALFVIVPRLALALHARHRERRLSAQFPLSIDEPYFRRVLSGWRESSAHVRVLPYAYTPSGAAAEGVRRLAEQLFGAGVRLHVARPVAFGEEDAFAPDAVEAGDAPRAPDLVIVLFNLASTPETENHGVFLERLESRAKGRLVVVVDEAPYRKRLGAQAGADRRLDERRRAWSGLVATRGLRALCADLESPDLAAVARELDHQLSMSDAPA